MPELSDRQREQAAQLQPAIANERLVACLELGRDIEVKCMACGTSKTWRRADLLGRLKPYLNATLAQMQAKAVCPRCGGHRPRLALLNGAYHDRPIATQRERVILLLMDAGLNPSEYGYRSPTRAECAPSPVNSPRSEIPA